MKTTWSFSVSGGCLVEGGRCVFICHTRQRSTGAESPGSFVKEWPLIQGGRYGGRRR